MSKDIHDLYRDVEAICQLVLRDCVNLIQKVPVWARVSYMFHVSWPVSRIWRTQQHQFSKGGRPMIDFFSDGIYKEPGCGPDLWCVVFAFVVKVQRFRRQHLHAS